VKSGNSAIDDVAKEKARAIASEMFSLVNKLIPETFYDGEYYERGEGKQWSDGLGCQYLMRLLLIMPAVLREVDLPIREYDQAVCYVRELLDFVAQNHKQFFNESFHLPNELYESEPTVPSLISPRIRRACCSREEDIDETNGSEHCSGVEENGEIVQPQDRLYLTDFVAGVMSQMIITRASPEDVNRKNRRVPVGHPCIVCRHCLGRNGEGKYFFGSIESMTSASTVIEKHLLRCPDFDEKKKQELIVETRKTHSEQRKSVPSGAQGAFFAQLFDRLSSMRPLNGSEYDPYTSSAIMSVSSNFHGSDASLGDSSSIGGSDSNDGFKTHIDVLKFIQSTEPWNSMGHLGEMVEKYYNCLEYGGKIVNTSSSPLNFSSEWLLAKVSPEK